MRRIIAHVALIGVLFIDAPFADAAQMAGDELGIVRCSHFSRVQDAREIKALIRALTSEDVEVREQAMASLLRHGEASVGQLSKAAQSGNPELAARAAYLLKVISVSHSLTDNLKKEVPGVAVQLTGGNVETRIRLFRHAAGLADLKPEDLESFARILVKGQLSEQDLLSVAEIALGRGLLVGTEATLELVLSKEPDVQIAAVRLLALYNIRRGIPNVEVLLKHPSQAVRAEASRALGSLDARASAVQLRPLLKDAMPDVRQSAVEALGVLKDRTSMPDMVEMLKDPDASIRAVSVRTLGSFTVGRHVEAMIPLLGDSETEVRRAAVATLRRLISEPEVSQHLIGQLTHVSPEMRRCTLEVLGAMGRPVPEVVQRVVPLLRDQHKDVQKQAVWTLAEMRSRRAIPKLVSQLDDGYSEVRRQSVRWLGLLSAREAVQKLIELLRDPSIAVRTESAWALGRIGDRSAIEPMRSVFKSDRNALVRDALMQAFLTMRAESALPDVRTLLTESNSGVRLSAARWLCEMGSLDGVPVLLKAPQDTFLLNRLKEPSVWHRLRAAKIEREGDAGLDSAILMAIEAAGLEVSIGSGGEELRTLVGGISKDTQVQVMESASLVEALQRLFTITDYTGIVEGKRVVIESDETALEKWTDWWETTTNHK